MTATRTVAAVLTGLALSACGGGGGTPNTPSPPPTPSTNVLTISSSGVLSPKELTVALGARVLFVNNDTRRHDMTSDPHPDHMDCPPLNQVGLLTLGQQRESGNFVTARTCGFHDHEDPDNTNLKGRIIIR